MKFRALNFDYELEASVYVESTRGSREVIFIRQATMMIPPQTVGAAKFKPAQKCPNSAVGEKSSFQVCYYVHRFYALLFKSIFLSFFSQGRKRFFSGTAISPSAAAFLRSGEKPELNVQVSTQNVPRTHYVSSYHEAHR